MKRRLSLRAERLTQLSEEELRVAGGAGESLTYQIDCILTLRWCYTQRLCSVLCFQTEQM